MNSATGPEVAPQIPYLAVPSPTTSPPPGTLILGGPPILGRVPAAGDLVPMSGSAQARMAPVRAPVEDATGCWLQTWIMTSQRTLRSIPSQRLHPHRLHPLHYRLSIDNGGSLRKRRRRGYTRAPWLVLNRCKVSSRYLLLSRAHHSARFVKLSDLQLHR